GLRHHCSPPAELPECSRSARRTSSFIVSMTRYASRRSDPPDQRLRPSTCLRAWSMRYCLRAWSKSSVRSLIGVSLGFRGGIGGLVQPRLDLLRRPVVLPPAPAVITTQLDPRLRSQRLVTTDRSEQR